MNITIFCLAGNCDWCSIIIGFALSVLLTVIWTRLLFNYFYKPNLKIDIPEVKANLIKFQIVNNSKSRIVKIQVEACIVETVNLNELITTKTFHYNFFEKEFVMLPSENENKGQDLHKRYFKIIGFSQQAILEDPNLQNEPLVGRLNGKNYLRVRVHASHENSGFGKAFEARFKYNGTAFEKLQL